MLDIVAWHNRTTADHQTQLNTYAAKGYRTLSLSIYDLTSNSLYACVMIKRPVLIAERQFFGLTAAAFQKTFDDMSTARMGPHIVSATGSGSAPLFAASFIPVKPTPLTRFGLTADQFNTLNQEQTSAGNKLVWFDCYGDAGNDLYIAVWWPNPEMMAWNCDGLGEAGTNAQLRFNALSNTWARLTQVLTTPSGKITSLYTDSVVGQYQVQYGLSSDQYQSAFNEWYAKGLVPLRVCAQGGGGNAVFGAVFGQTEDANPRVWRSSGPVSVTSVDTAIETFLKATDIRDASLAIVDGTRLVYAKGYTWAEPSYPDSQPTTLYRQASCSKIFAAYALYHLLQQQVAKTPVGQAKPTLLSVLQDTKFQSVLHLTQPSGAAPADPKFAQITLLDLMTSTSGLNQNLIWDSVAAAAANAPLPASREQLARYGAAQTFTATPGNPKNVVYGNFDYFLIGEVVRALSGAATFEAALETLIMLPLAMTRVRGSSSLLGDQLPDEAAYHLTQPAVTPPNGELTVSASVRTPPKPPVATQYGGFDMEILSSCGGLSVAVTDMARLVASLSLQSGSPTLTADTTSQWMMNAVQATDTLSGPEAHGYHGWDWVTTPSAGVYYGDKGGALPGTGTETYFTTGGLSYIFMLGSGGRPGVKVDWYQPLIDAATAHDWGTTDLFPQYGMPSFGTHPGQRTIRLGPAAPIGRRDFTDLEPKLMQAA